MTHVATHHATSDTSAPPSLLAGGRNLLHDLATSDTARADLVDNPVQFLGQHGIKLDRSMIPDMVKAPAKADCADAATASLTDDGQPPPFWWLGGFNVQSTTAAVAA